MASESYRVRGSLVGARLKKKLDNLQVIAPRGEVQGRVLHVVLRVDCRSTLEQNGNHGHMAGCGGARE